MTMIKAIRQQLSLENKWWALRQAIAGTLTVMHVLSPHTLPKARGFIIEVSDTALQVGDLLDAPVKLAGQQCQDCKAQSCKGPCIFEAIPCSLT